MSILICSTIKLTCTKLHAWIISEPHAQLTCTKLHAWIISEPHQIGLDVMQSYSLHAQDAFWPIPGLISCAGVLAIYPCSWHECSLEHRFSVLDFVSQLWKKPNTTWNVKPRFVAKTNRPSYWMTFDQSASPLTHVHVKLIVWKSSSVIFSCQWLIKIKCTKTK